jgi:hypothetical protein
MNEETEKRPGHTRAVEALKRNPRISASRRCLSASDNKCRRTINLQYNVGFPEMSIRVQGKLTAAHVSGGCPEASDIRKHRRFRLYLEESKKKKCLAAIL